MDKREKTIIFISSCILNQNNRFPGIAISEGVINEIIGPISKKGIGIEQLPCLECMEWGGVSRRTFFKFLPRVYKSLDSKMFPIVKFFMRIWIRNYRKKCRKVAKSVVRRIEDYMKSRYKILGFIVSNDSPTCGITRTINLVNSVKKLKDLGYGVEVFVNPQLEIMEKVIPNICEDGPGIFMNEIKKLLKKKKIMIHISGFNPWNDLNNEILNIKKELEL